MKKGTPFLTEHLPNAIVYFRYVKVLEKWLENVKPEDKKLEEESENVVVRKVFLNKLSIEEKIKFEEKATGNEITIPKEVSTSYWFNDLTF